MHDKTEEEQLEGTAMMPVIRIGGRFLQKGQKTYLELTGSRLCSSGVVYESTKITNKLLDASTLYQLAKYSR